MEVDHQLGGLGVRHGPEAHDEGPGAGHGEGTAQADTLTGDAGANVLSGLGGDDAPGGRNRSCV